MGGYGSTRWGSVRTRVTTGRCYRLRPGDLRAALRQVEADPAARAGCSLRLHWSRDGRALASIGADVVRAGASVELVLHYRAGRAGEAPEAIRERVPLEALDQRGAAAGRRWWFGCPGCGRRCGVLYLAPGRSRWRCRVCERLTYASCNASDKRISRAVRTLARGDGLGDVGAMGPAALGVCLHAYAVYRQRLARTLRRDMGKRAYKRHYAWLESAWP